ncbi:cell division protein ZipA C-terminal FtsZ-binding domain-containing protein [Stenoxybacter acetivorans]|uniref:cell division protein ZipA C-terminal FtsZ-binding domain-containing protein n=1 Tax=Stenoxybacter acetivorans TaxID=422441 RepID=UPI003CCBCC72
MIILVLGALVILAVIAYNMYQENQYRKQLRERFGHANKDALLDSSVQSVRDGQTTADINAAPLKPLHKNTSPAAPNDFSNQPQNIAQPIENTERAAVSPLDNSITAAAAEPVLQTAANLQKTDGNRFDFKKIKEVLPARTQVSGNRKPLLDVKDMLKQPLAWFEPRFDYMAAVALFEPKELHALPRLGGQHRFRMAGCTMDYRFQIAEPIPSVFYQGFVVGLQAISRRGLATLEELGQFSTQMNTFAEQMDGVLLLTDKAAFLETARPLDDLCARVDQTIAMHLVSRGEISGVELRTAVESQSFELSHDGAFYRQNEEGNTLFTLVTLDGSSFTASLLANQHYRGFSMLFDIVHVPAGEKYFNLFMDIAVKFSSQLGLDLVNDKGEELSTQWLKEVRRYVLEQQAEMRQVPIEPGGELAKRLFS